MNTDTAATLDAILKLKEYYIPTVMDAFVQKYEVIISSNDTWDDMMMWMGKDANMKEDIFYQWVVLMAAYDEDINDASGYYPEGPREDDDRFSTGNNPYEQ